MILFIGEILADVLMNAETGEMTAHLGGAPLNAAVSCAKHGGNAVFLGRVGDDPIGRFLQRKVAAFPVEARVQVDPVRPTTIAFVSVDASGERDFTFLRHDAADYAVEPGGTLCERAFSTVHIGSLMLSTERGRATAASVVRQAKEKGMTVSFDVNLREDIFRDKKEATEAYAPILAQADIVKFGEEEVEYFYGARYETALPSIGNPLVVVTLGKDGCIVKRGDTTVKVASRPVRCVDTTGAGDAFYGAFLAQLDGKDLSAVSAEELKRAAAVANEAGRHATTYKGALEE